jgi:hypothetical protein
MWNIYVSANLDEIFYFMALTDFPKLAKKLSVIRTVRPKNIFAGSKKKAPKNSLSCA